MYDAYLTKCGDELKLALEWEPAIRTIKIDLPSTKDPITELMESAAAIVIGEVCGYCFKAIHEAPKGENPGLTP
jgi:hypothetical protein